MSPGARACHNGDRDPRTPPLTLAISRAAAHTAASPFSCHRRCRKHYHSAVSLRAMLTAAAGCCLLEGRASSCCANPTCTFLVHEDPSFGGFCCKRCHWGFVQGSTSGKEHGVKCQQREACQGAPRAVPVPPDKPCSWGGRGGGRPRGGRQRGPEHQSGAGPVINFNGESVCRLA